MMLTKNKRISIALLIIFTFCGYLFITKNNLKLLLCNQSNTVLPSITNNDNLKIKYFDDAIGVWGSGLANGETQWKGIDSKYAQRSAPSPVTHPLEFKQESVKYGKSISGYFTSKREAITSSMYFDVDNDGIKEQIIETVTIGGNHPPYFGYIIKNGVIILSVSLNSGGIELAKDGNGFYVQNKMYEDKGLCCPVGYRLYRVIYEDNSFKSVWEQEVKYISFDDTI